MAGQSSALIFGKILAVAVAIAVVAYFVIGGHRDVNPTPAASPAGPGPEVQATGSEQVSPPPAPAPSTPAAPSAPAGLDNAANTSPTATPPPRPVPNIGLKKDIFMGSSKAGILRKPTPKALDAPPSPAQAAPQK